MSNKTKKELVILSVILVLLTISLYSQFSRNDAGPVLSPASRRTIESDQASREVLEMEMLTAKSPEFTSVRRNIFQFGSGQNNNTAAQPVPDPVQETEAVAPPVPQTPPVRYLGFYYEKNTGLKMASLSNTGKVYVGKVGEVVGGRYEVVEIASNYVVLRLRMEGNRLIRVPLGRAPSSFMDAVEDQQ